MTVEPPWATLLRRMALDDERTIEGVLSTSTDGVGGYDLDDKARCLVRIAALIAIESATPSYQRVVGLALAAGATENELVDVLLTVAPIAGTARAISAAPSLAVALGCNVDDAFET